MTAAGEEAKDALLKANITGEELGVLTPQIIASGSWKTASFRPYGLDAPVQRLIPGRHNPYANYIQWV
ncbi:MAG: phenylalanine--tRNA ligase subunit alpha, partial [Spirochaetales bacterium]|nr:phenylalanine--tRNA ligase subunit alpha [Spirochaetales bacterium]